MTARSGFYVYRTISLAFSAGLILVGCNRADPTAIPVTATQPPTAWPTLAPPTTSTRLPTSDSSVVDIPTGPQLIDLFRVEVLADATAIYPLKGEFSRPVRVEVVVLEGDLDPMIVINSLAGDQLAQANSGGPGQPEVIGQFIFPGDSYYELGILSVSGQGTVGVSIYQLSPVDLEGGGIFTSIDEELAGTMSHPASYHTFRIPLERGTRVDIEATAITEDLDLLFELYAPDGSLVAARDDNVEKNPALWNFMPDQDGEYTLVLSNFDEHTGEYVIALHPSKSGGAAVIGTRTTLEVQGVPRRSTWLTMEGVALDAVEVEARPLSSGVDLVVTITDPYGNVLVSVNQGEVGEPEEISLAQFPFNGEYHIEFLTLNESGEIDYFIHPVRGADLEMGGPTTPGEKRHEGFVDGPGTAIVYAFDAVVNDLIGIDAHATGGFGLDLGFTLYDPDGFVVLTADDVVGKDPIIDRIELALAGRYALVIWNYADTTGPFELFITNPDAPDLVPDE